jgi:class 3 adenylate cyclase/predicted ATPase
VSSIAEWLASLGMSEYAERFAENRIDLSVLPDLTDQHLEKLGVALGDRLKILRAIRERSATTVAVAQRVAATAPVGQDSAERRQLTVMFCDLVGSTALSGRLDPEDLRGIIGAYHRCCTDVIERNGGFVAKYMGDGVLAYFGYPQAHEHDAERAVRAGLALVEAVPKLETAAAGTSLQVRVGIATGLVVVGDLIGSGEAQERGIVGETPNLAARLQGIAEPNMVIIAESTRRLLGNLFEFQDLGASELKGIAGPSQAWAVLRARSVESRFEALHAAGLTALVGREEESDLLLRRWARAKVGDGQVVLISGEAGIGKSRLTATLLDRPGGEPHTRLRYFCSPQHMDSALYPIVGQMERAAGLTHDDTPRARLDKLDAVLAQTSTSIEDAALFAEMLSLPNDGRYPAPELAPQQRRERTLTALVSQMEVLARQGPVLMIFEDAQWIDPTSLEALGRLVDRTRTLRVLLIVTFRPEFNPPWIGQPHVTAVTINRLTQRQVGAMIDGVVGNKLLPTSVREDIIDRTDGVPLFVEEMTKAVLEAESEGQAQRAVAAAPSPALGVPASLHASLMARLDRLGPAKEVAQIGAAIGREFSYALLASVVRKPEAELVSALDRLVAAGLLFRQGVPPNATYLFKHALVQDAAYGTLLRRRRQELHARVATTLEQHFTDLVDRQPEMLAHHLTGAGQAERASDQWLKAGQFAASRSAYAEAVSHFDRGLSLLPSLSDAQRDRQEIKLQLAKGVSLINAKGFSSAEAAKAHARAQELSDKTGDIDSQFGAIWGLWTFRRVSDLNAGRELSDKLLSLVEKNNNVGLRLEAHHTSWTTHFFRGEPAPAQEHCEKGRTLYDFEQHRTHAHIYGHDPGVCARMVGAWSAWLLGYPDTALARVNDAFALAERVNHPFSLALARLHASILHQFRRDSPSVLQCIESAETLAAEKRVALSLDPRVLRGWALLVPDGIEAAIASYRAALADPAKQGSIQYAPYSFALFCEVLCRMGNHSGGAEALMAAAAIAEQSGERWWDAEISRLRGLVALSRGEFGESNAWLLKSLQIARQQQAKSLELRAAMSMARLRRDQGKRQQAHDLLAPVYGWFTEGFDTLDLKEAKALLEELR